MTPQEKRKELLSATLLKNLEKRHFEAYYCPTAAEAVEKVLSLIPEGSSVTWGGSMTIRDMGLTKAVKEGSYEVIDRDTAKDPAEMREMMRQGLLTDYYLTSTNAISEEELKAGGSYILGSKGGVLTGSAYFFAPAGGTVSDFTMSDGGKVVEEKYHDLEVGFVAGMVLSPQKTVTVTYNVTTAPGAETPMVFSQTPTVQDYHDAS